MPTTETTQPLPRICHSRCSGGTADPSALVGGALASGLTARPQVRSATRWLGIAGSARGSRAAIRALKIDEKCAQAWNDRGICYREISDYTTALKSCLRAVELDPGNPELLFALGVTLEQIGVLYMSTKYLDSAIQVFKMVVDQLPNNMESWNYLGICYKEMGNDTDAKFHFDRAREIRSSGKDTPIVSRRSEYH
jgi:Flp pilus assembly protein TadD